MTDSLLTDAQNARIRELDAKVVEQGGVLADALAEAGKTLAELFAGHALEDLAKQAVLDPLKRDALALVALLARIDIRLQTVTPPLSVEQFRAGAFLQMQDISEAAQASAERNNTEEELQHLVALAYVELATGCATMEAAAQTMDRGRASNGGLSPDDNSLVGTLKRSAKNQAKVADAITALRRKHAQSEARS